MNPPARVLNIHWFIKSVEGKFKYHMNLAKVGVLSCIYYDSLDIASISRLTGLTQHQVSLYLREMEQDGLVTLKPSVPHMITILGRNLVSFVAGAAKGDYVYEPPKAPEAKAVRTAKAKRPSASKVLTVPCADEPEAHGAASSIWKGGAGEPAQICVASLEVPSMVP